MQICSCKILSWLRAKTHVRRRKRATLDWSDTTFWLMMEFCQLSPSIERTCARSSHRPGCLGLQPEAQPSAASLHSNGRQPSGSNVTRCLGRKSKRFHIHTAVLRYFWRVWCLRLTLGVFEVGCPCGNAKEASEQNKTGIIIITLFRVVVQTPGLR